MATMAMPRKTKRGNGRRGGGAHARGHKARCRRGINLLACGQQTGMGDDILRTLSMKKKKKKKVVLDMEWKSKRREAHLLSLCRHGQGGFPHFLFSGKQEANQEIGFLLLIL